MTQEAAGDDVSQETRMLVARARQQAAGLPDSSAIAGMAFTAIRGGNPDLTIREIHDLAVHAISQANQVSFLLGRLAGILGDDDVR